MKRKLTWVGLFIGLLMVCLMASPTLASSTNQMGSWSLFSDYHFAIPDWGWDLNLDCNYEGWIWGTSVDRGKVTWYGHIAVAEINTWSWDDVATEADVDLFDVGAGFQHKIIGPLGVAIEADFHSLSGVDAASFNLYSGNLLLGPVVSKEVDMLLGTWMLNAHALVGPGLQVVSATHHGSETFCGVAVDLGAELGYLLFDTLGLSVSVNQKYEMSPWSDGTSNLYSSDQFAYSFSGVLRF